MWWTQPSSRKTKSIDFSRSRCAGGTTGITGITGAGTATTGTTAIGVGITDTGAGIATTGITGIGDGTTTTGTIGTGGDKEGGFSRPLFSAVGWAKRSRPR
jgi:hypothetical protein